MGRTRMWHRLGRTLFANRPLAELRAALGRSEIIAIDLDQCIVPGYSQTTLGQRIASRILRSPIRASDRKFLPRLGLGGLFFGIKEVRRFLGRSTPMRKLIARYERVMRGIPISYVLDAAAGIPSRAYACAAETIAQLARLAPTGIVTLGLDVVARAFQTAFQTDGHRHLSFFAANRVVFDEAGGDEPAFLGYDPEALLLTAEDKRKALERQMSETGATVPAIIGHDEGDLALAALARGRDGLAIGFNPSRKCRDAFDIVVDGADWEPMYALMTMLSPALRKHYTA